MRIDSGLGWLVGWRGRRRWDATVAAEPRFCGYCRTALSAKHAVVPLLLCLARQPRGGCDGRRSESALWAVAVHSLGQRYNILEVVLADLNGSDAASRSCGRFLSSVVCAKPNGRELAASRGIPSALLALGVLLGLAIADSKFFHPHITRMKLEGLALRKGTAFPVPQVVDPL